MKKIFAYLTLGFTTLTTYAATPLWMRDIQISPDGTEIVFCYKGDIYKVSAKGGTATQLTTQESYESSPVWSPDGKQIAFASDRQGNFDVFVMPSDGGAAQRLTTNSAGEIPSAFTPDGKYILFSAAIQDPAGSALFPSPAMTELYKVPATGGRTEQVLGTPAEALCFDKTGDMFSTKTKKDLKTSGGSTTPLPLHVTYGCTTAVQRSTPTSPATRAKTATPSSRRTDRPCTS